LRFFKYTIVQFVKCVLLSTHFINKIANLSDEEVAEMKIFYQSMIIKILMYIKSVTKSEELHATTNRSKFWKIMLHHCYEILEGTLSLLTPDSLLMVVFGLINHQYPMVRKKVIELFNRKLQYQNDYFNDCNKANMLKLLDPFRMIVSTILDEAGGESRKEADVIKQNALIAIKLLSKELVEDHVDEFKDVLDQLTDILKSHAHIAPNILASLILTNTELIINLKAHALVCLPRFMPILIGIMKKYNSSNADIQVSIVMSVYKIIDTLPLFLSPYLKEIITHLCKLYANVGGNMIVPSTTNKLNAIVANKLKLVWEKLATTIPVRIFIPTIEECYEELIETKEIAAIGILMKLLSKGFQHFESNEFADYNGDITKLFLSALQFRCDNAASVDFDDASVNEVEECIMEAFVSLIMKLSEASFRLLYFKIYDWAIRESNSKERAITFYK
jgi:U3 small nucleolar RNA-associated protein 10